jgi:hypothetical protein
VLGAPHRLAGPELSADPDLVADMDLVRDVASSASSLRKAHKLRVRLPLPKLTVAVDNSQWLRPYLDLLADELNVERRSDRRRAPRLWCCTPKSSPRRR